QASVWLLTVAKPSGPEVSLLPVKPANPELTNCEMLWVAPSITSTDLLLRSAKKYLLSTGSYQLMSNEENAATPGTWMTWVTLNTSSFLNPPSSLQAVPVSASAAIAPAEDAKVSVLRSTPLDDVRIGQPPYLSID